MQRLQQQRALQRRSKLTTTKELERGAPAGTTGRCAPSPFKKTGAPRPLLKQVRPVPFYPREGAGALAVAVILNAHARPVALL